MQGMSERDYAARAGLSRGAIQKAKSAGRLVLHAEVPAGSEKFHPTSRPKAALPEIAPN